MSVILIVEDELLELEFLESVVAEELCQTDKILTCQSGIHAIELAREHRPDIIIMDIIIPELDGLHALEEIRKFHPQACVMIISAYSDFSYAQTAIRLRVKEYLLKPVKPSIFKQAFRTLLTNVAKEQLNPVAEIAQPTINQIDVVEKSIKYIHDNFKQKLPLQLVSDYVFMNPQYFSRIFKKEVGVNYIDYVNKLKIDYACKLLETTNYTAYRISSECGFSDPSYFNRVFVQQMKMTPKAYSKKMHFA